MTGTRICAAALAALLCVLAGCGREEPPPSEATTEPAAQGEASSPNVPPTAAVESAVENADTGSMLNEVDREFATQAFASSIAEVQAGRLAAEKTRNEDVREFAQEMVKDHTASNEELTRIAQTKKIELPTAPLASFKEPLQQMTTVTGPQHDRFYVERFGAAAHAETVKLYEREVREGQDGELRDYAERWLLVLREHLERAEKLARNIDASP